MWSKQNYIFDVALWLSGDDQAAPPPESRQHLIRFSTGFTVQAAMRAVILFSIFLGLIWNTIAVCLMGGKVADAFQPSALLAGATAGIVAGLFTVWSRRRRDGAESILYGVATYYLGIPAYWASFVENLPPIRS